MMNLANIEQYLKSQIFKFYYDQIKKTDSDERDVDRFYSNTLREYFPGSQMYGLELESRPLKKLLGLTEYTDRFAIHCVRAIRNARQSKKVVVIVECKRREDEETPNADWGAAALEHGIDYVKLIRTEDG